MHSLAALTTLETVVARGGCVALEATVVPVGSTLLRFHTGAPVISPQKVLAAATAHRGEGGTHHT